MPFLPPNQQRQSTEGTTYIHTNLYSAKNRENESEALAQNDGKGKLEEVEF